MNAKYQGQKERDNALSTSNAAIGALDPVKEVSSITPAKAAFGTVSTLLAKIKDSMINEEDYVELGLSCAEVCKVLDRGLNGRQFDELSQPVLEAIQELAITMAEIQRKIVKKGERNITSRLLHARNDKEMIAAWKLDLNRLLHVFNAELAINTHTMVACVYRGMLAGQGGADDRPPSVQASILVGESPPPPPRACFGRDELIGKIADFAGSLTPIALVGAGGIGKTAIALTVLHHDRIKQRFEDNRRFIRCDQFPASRFYFLRRLSKVTGAGIENPEDFVSLRPFLSSKEMFIVLDNAESILDPQGADAQGIYDIVEELSQFRNICLCLTSRITTIPPDCQYLDVPTLPADAARSTFYHICKNDERPDLISNILEQLDFHPLSVALLATVARQNRWDNNRLFQEWEQRQTGLLQIQHNKSLGATIELSLASPMFQDLGPDARGLLEVVAFFPQGVDENNLDWLFPTIPGRKDIFATFCTLSLAYRSGSFITMLAPLRDHLCPRDLKSSQILCRTKERYFTRMPVDLHPSKPGFADARWISLEDINIEHLLDVFTSFDPNSNHTWNACANFLRHLSWHKKRRTVLKSKIKGLPDHHPSKPKCLFELARSFQLVGSHVERKELLTELLKLERERRDDAGVARALRWLSDANRWLGPAKEGIQYAEEAIKICERLGDTVGQAESFLFLARSLRDDGEVDAAERSAFQAIDLLPERGQEYLLCRSHRILSGIFHSKGEREKAIHHSEVSLEIASPFGWHDQLLWTHFSLATLLSDGDRFNDAHAHIEQARSHATGDPYFLGRTMERQAIIWFKQRRLQEARSGALCAFEAFERFGASEDLERCRRLLQDIERV